MSKPLFGAAGAAILIAAGALTVSTDASAAIVQNAAGACQVARSTYAASLRARPTGINNEGTADIYVSCSMSTPDFYLTANDVNGVVLSNRGSADKRVDCTLAAGSYENLPSTLYPKSITVPAGVSSVVLSWDPVADNGGVNFLNTINYSCILPPGIDLQSVFTNAVPNPAIAVAP